jgi:FtsZ-interacting cell division protein YlmF
MSEYQYYEFQAMDRPLSEKEREELRGYSSRAQITASSFVNVYHFGSFKGNPGQWMEKYFDAFLYLANWGNRTLMFRVPAKLLASNAVAPYCAGESLTCWTKGDHCIVSFDSQEEESEWAEGEGWLSSLIPLRTELMRGDVRCLYLGWLRAALLGEFDDATLEPPVPANLTKLHAPLRQFAEFLRIDEDWIAAAAERSADRATARVLKEDIARRIAKLPPQEKDDLLVNLVETDDPHVVLEFRRRLLAETQPATIASNSEPRRSVGELRARAEAIAANRETAEAERRAREQERLERERAAHRRAHLDSLAGKEDALWSRVESLIVTKQPKRYDEAVSLLADLRDLAERRTAHAEFSTKLETLCRQHAAKASLLQRIRAAGQSR